MSNKVVNFVPNRIDRDPSVIMGVTGPEVFQIVWMCIPAFILFGIVSGILFQSFVGGLFSGFLGAIINLFGGILLVAKVKRNKPPHYIAHKKVKKLDKLGIKPAPIIYSTEHFRSTRD
ncbi:MAG: TIGR03750 family conjugal transfer protein [Methylococcaceae bacterium]|nr:TIGR03750 family conjugal transfer protein [Methylococcaceae bacterium]